MRSRPVIADDWPQCFTVLILSFRDVRIDVRRNVEDRKAGHDPRPDSGRTLRNSLGHAMECPPESGC